VVARGVMVVVAVLLGTARPGFGATFVAAHPLHTTLTEITVDPSKHTVRAVIRVFADDIGAALVKRSGSKGAPVAASDADATAYVLSELSIGDQSLRPVALRSCGVKRSGDLLWICLETGPVDPKVVRVRNTVLCELFSDQVNIVQVSGAGVARSILFTRGDGPKALL
jgi:hypothetical protein